MAGVDRGGVERRLEPHRTPVRTHLDRPGGYSDRAAELVYRQLLPFRPYPGALGTSTVYFTGTISRNLGELAETFGDRATAIELLREALPRNRAMPPRWRRTHWTSRPGWTCPARLPQPDGSPRGSPLTVTKQIR